MRLEIASLEALLAPEEHAVAALGVVTPQALDDAAKRVQEATLRLQGAFLEVNLAGYGLGLRLLDIREKLPRGKIGEWEATRPAGLSPRSIFDYTRLAQILRDLPKERRKSVAASILERPWRSIPKAIRSYSKTGVVPPPPEKKERSETRKSPNEMIVVLQGDVFVRIGERPFEDQKYHLKAIIRDATALLEQIALEEAADSQEKKPRRESMDCYLTPEELSIKAVSWMNPIEEGEHILEPSFGAGDFARVLSAAGAKVSGVELNLKRFAQGREHLDLAFCGSFLDHQPLPGVRYSRVIGNPPFAGAEKHVVHALSMADEVAFILPLRMLKKKYGLQGIATPLRVIIPSESCSFNRPDPEDQEKVQAVTPAPVALFWWSPKHLGSTIEVCSWRDGDAGQGGVEEPQFYELKDAKRALELLRLPQDRTTILNDGQWPLEGECEAIVGSCTTGSVTRVHEEAMQRLVPGGTLALVAPLRSLMAVCRLGFWKKHAPQEILVAGCLKVEDACSQFTMATFIWKKGAESRERIPLRLSH